MAGPVEIVLSLLLSVSISVWIYVFLRRWFENRKYRLPPGPTGWPLLGYVEFVLSDKPTELMMKVKEKYGSVIGFHIGSRYCVMLSDFPAVKEAFNRKSLLARPPGYFRTSADCKNFTEMEGHEWEAHKYFFTSSLKSLGVGKSKFEDLVVDELSRAISSMELFVGQSECNIKKVLCGPLSNTMFQILCSRWFDYEDPFMERFQKFLTMSSESFSNNMAFIYFPWLDGILNKLHPHSKEIQESLNEVAEVLRKEIKSRESTHTEYSSHDYFDLYLNEMKSGKKSLDFFDKKHLVANSLLFLMSGSDRTRNTLQWLLMSMAQFQDIQEKVFQEIYAVFGTEKTPSYADKASLPYTEATLLESQRWKTLVPLNCLRWTTEDTVVQGFDIPRNSIVMNNLFNCHMDPRYWKNPEEFVPDRFLSDDKSRVVVPEYFMPFSLGKRSCPADKFVAVELFLYFSTIVQKFKLLPPDGGVCFEEVHRVNLQALRPIIKIERR